MTCTRNSEGFQFLLFFLFPLSIYTLYYCTYSTYSCFSVLGPKKNILKLLKTAALTRILRINEDKQKGMERTTIPRLQQFVRFTKYAYCKDTENEKSRTCSIYEGEEKYI